MAERTRLPDLTRVTTGMTTPPPGAPHEVTTAEAITVRAAVARQAPSLDLPAFVPRPMTRVQQVAMIGEAAVARIEAQQGVHAAGAPDAPVAATRPAVQTPRAVQTPAPVQPAATNLRAPRARPRPAVSAQAQDVVTMILTPDGTQGAALSPETRAAIDVVAATARALSAADVGVGAQAQAQQIAPPLLAPIQPHQRAASDTDSPSRGVPAFPTDPGKQITGGFGDQLDAQYFPLTGAELAAVARDLCAKLDRRLADDLRFSIAAVYPRVAVRLDLTVTGYASEPLTIPVVYASAPNTPGSSPLDVARHFGTEIVFVLRDELVEMTDDGVSVTPPNATREALGLRVPRKQRVKSGLGYDIIDVPGGV